MELTKEYIKENKLIYRYSKDTSWEIVVRELSDYDEGYVTRRYVFRNKDTDEFWEYYESSNSWDNYDVDEDGEPTQVYPRQVTVTEYFTDKE